MAKRFEYSTGCIGDGLFEEMEMLDKRGKDGWELIFIVGNKYYFKKENI